MKFHLGKGRDPVKTFKQQFVSIRKVLVADSKVIFLYLQRKGAKEYTVESFYLN